MLPDFLLTALGLLGLVVGVVVDVRTKEIPDFVTYGMIFAGFGVRLIHSVLTGVWSYFLHAIPVFIIMAVLGCGLYYAKQWGGGDAKLLMGLGVLFATKPSFVGGAEQFLRFPFYLLINILLFGALYGVIYGIVLALQHKKKFLKEITFLNRQKTTRRMKVIALFLALVLFGLSYSFLEDLRMRLIVNSGVLFILLFPYIKIFVKAIENSCLYHVKSVEDVTEGDWVEQDVILKGKMIYKRRPFGIEKSDIQRLKDAHVQKILVKEGIPFAPPFLVGVLVTLWLGGIAVFW